MRTYEASFMLREIFGREMPSAVFNAINRYRCRIVTIGRVTRRVAGPSKNTAGETVSLAARYELTIRLTEQRAV